MSPPSSRLATWDGVNRHDTIAGASPRKRAMRSSDPPGALRLRAIASSILITPSRLRGTRKEQVPGRPPPSDSNPRAVSITLDEPAISVPPRSRPGSSAEPDARPQCLNEARRPTGTTSAFLGSCANHLGALAGAQRQQWRERSFGGACDEGKANRVEGEHSPGVHLWSWRDNLPTAPGLFARLGTCLLAVCALWLTSLKVAGEGAFKSGSKVTQNHRAQWAIVRGAPFGVITSRLTTHRVDDHRLHPPLLA